MVSPRNIRFALALLVTSVIIGIVAAITLKGSRTSLPGPVVQKLPQNIDVALNNARFAEMRDGVPVWELVAKHAEYDKSGELAFLNDIHMVYFKRGAQGSITVTASKGDYSAATKRIRLRGRVHVETESGLVFDTTSLDYQAEKSLFQTVDRVTLHHERLSLEATGMELDARKETSRFGTSIRAVLESQ